MRSAAALALLAFVLAGCAKERPSALSIAACLRDHGATVRTVTFRHSPAGLRDDWTGVAFVSYSTFDPDLNPLARARGRLPGRRPQRPRCSASRPGAEIAAPRPGHRGPGGRERALHLDSARPKLPLSHGRRCLGAAVPGTAVRRTGHVPGTCPEGTVGWRGAPDRRPLRGHLLRPPERLPAGVHPAPDAEGRRLGARARGRRRVQAAELDDAADGDRGQRRAARDPQARRPQRGPARDQARRGALRRPARHGRGGGAREGRRRARPAAAARRRPDAHRAKGSASSSASGRPTSAPST